MTPEFAVQFAALIAENYKQEIATTKRVLAAVPEDKDKWAYRPDPRSMSAIELVWHMAGSDVWFLNAIAAASFSYEPAQEPVRPASIAGIVAWYDRETSSGLAKLSAVKPEQWALPVKFGGSEKALALHMTFAVRHSVHHRGQLSSYLRPMGSKVPSIYGSSADERK